MRVSTSAFLGVRIETANGGARIATVRPGTPAAKAGLRVGDVITRVGATSIASADDLRNAIDAHAPNDRVSVHIRRNGRALTISVKLANRPS